MGNPFSEPKSQEAPKKPMIVEMKDKPENVAISTEDGKLVLVIRVLDEPNAKGIDLNLSTKELHLESEK
jgi:hypothetical protein